VAFKYDDELRNINNCPPPKLLQGKKLAYRFVHEPLCSDSFMPVAKLQPSRIFKGKGKCLSWGLSMYDTLSKAQNKITDMEIYNPNIRKSLGNKFAVGEIREETGSYTQSGSDGHFTLFEDANNEIENDFRLVEESEYEDA